MKRGKEWKAKKVLQKYMKQGAPSAGIRVGKDKSEATRSGTRFWSIVLEYEKKGKITSDEV